MKVLCAVILASFSFVIHGVNAEASTRGRPHFSHSSHPVYVKHLQTSPSRLRPAKLPVTHGSARTYRSPGSTYRPPVTITRNIRPISRSSITRPHISRRR